MLHLKTSSGQNDAKVFLLTPELLPGAPSKAVTAAARA